MIRKRERCSVPGCRRLCSGVRPVCNDHWERTPSALRVAFWNAFTRARYSSDPLASKPYQAAVAAIVAHHARSAQTA